MISFDFNFSDPFDWLLLALVTMLLAVQLWLILKSNALAGGKRNLKIGLNLLLWIVTLAFILQPYWHTNSSSKNVLVKGDEVTDVEANRVKDSLGLSELYSQENFKAKSYDTVMLMGRDFKPEFFTRLSQSGQAVVKRIANSREDELENINWAGILRKGQIQHVRGSIHSSIAQPLKISFAGKTLDSIQLTKGFNSFDLEFPVFAQGRVFTTLNLGNKTMDTVRFFARQAESKVYQFVLDSPDFETRTLANWLGQNGNSVMITATLSKNIQSKKTINKAGEPDIFITDPSNSNHPVIKKALANGKSILLIGLDQAEKEFVILNNALGSKFNLERVSMDENVPVSQGLTALPFKFANSERTYNIPDLPVAITKTNAKIGVSLLNETYPLMLSGDSVAYNKLWTTVLARIAPADSSNIEIISPVFKGISSVVQTNNNNSEIREILAEDALSNGENDPDSLFAISSSINKKTVRATFFPASSGRWMHLGAPFQDTEFYIEDSLNFNAISQSSRLDRFVSAYSSHAGETSGDLAKYEANIKKQTPGYVWFLLFLFCFTALWAEPKFMSV